MSQDECARANVVVLREAGFSYSRIAAVTGKSISFVQRWVERKRATGGVKRKSCAGRPKKLTSNVLHEIKKSMKSKATGSIRRTQRKLESMDIRVSKSSISRSIKILGLKRVKERKRPKLTPAHHEQRVDFANAHVNRPNSYWKRLLFTDETILLVEPPPGTRYISDGEELPTVDKSKFGAKIMVWAGISYSGRTDLILCGNGSMDSEKYQEVLARGSIACITRFRTERTGCFNKMELVVTPPAVPGDG